MKRSHLTKFIMCLKIFSGGCYVLIFLIPNTIFLFSFLCKMHEDLTKQTTPFLSRFISFRKCKVYITNVKNKLGQLMYNIKRQCSRTMLWQVHMMNTESASYTYNATAFISFHINLCWQKITQACFSQQNTFHASVSNLLSVQ